MSDEHLREWRPEALVALIRRLEERLAAVTAQLAAAEARIGELEAELARRGGPPKTPENSSTPPSKGWKRERPGAAPEGAKRGRRVGHPGAGRRRGGPPRGGLCQPTHCAACGHDLTAGPQVRVGHSQVVELPPVQPVVFEAWRYAATCPHCGTTTTAEYPAGFEPTRVFGPRLEALWTYLHERHHVGYARLAALGRGAGLPGAVPLGDPPRPSTRSGRVGGRRLHGRRAEDRGRLRGAAGFPGGGRRSEPAVGALSGAPRAPVRLPLRPSGAAHEQRLGTSPAALGGPSQGHRRLPFRLGRRGACSRGHRAGHGAQARRGPALDAARRHRRAGGYPARAPHPLTGQQVSRYIST